MTTPVDELTVATEVEVLVQTPPEVTSVSVVVAPTQTAGVPVIAATEGAPPTVIVFVATTVPQLPEIEYEITTVPAETPVTTPELATVAIDGEALDQLPPEIESASVIDAPTQTVDGPVIVPADDEPVETVTV